MSNIEISNSNNSNQSKEAELNNDNTNSCGYKKIKLPTDVKSIKPFFPKSMQNSNSTTADISNNLTDYNNLSNQGTARNYRNSINVELDKQFVVGAGINENLPKSSQNRRLSKNGRRVSKSRFNEIYGYDGYDNKQPKIVPIERNKFNMKPKHAPNIVQNIQEAIGYKNYYKTIIQNGSLTTFDNKRQRSLSKDKPRFSLNNYYENPLVLDSSSTNKTITPIIKVVNEP